MSRIQETDDPLPFFEFPENQIVLKAIPAYACLAAPEDSNALYGPKHRNAADSIGRRQLHPIRQENPRPSAKQRGYGDCTDKEKLSQFHPDVEEEERQWDCVLRQADFVQRA